jgi:DNA-binding LacI/PurR family transcriptional regulator
MPNPTISDVASSAGVSKATVSRCLNGDLIVRPETAKCVYQPIADLARTGVQLLKDCIERRGPGEREVRLPVELIERASAAVPSDN